MERIELGPVGGARYYVSRPDWARRAARAVTARVGLAAVLAGAWVGGCLAVHAVFGGFLAVAP